QSEGFAQCLPVDHERHVYRELHHGAGTDWTAILNAATQLLEKRLDSRDLSGFSAHESNQLAFSRRAGRAAHGTFHERGTLGPDLLCKRRLGLRLDSAHLDEHLATHIRCEQARGAAVDLIDSSRLG